MDGPSQISIQHSQPTDHWLQAISGCSYFGIPVFLEVGAGEDANCIVLAEALTNSLAAPSAPPRLSPLTAAGPRSNALVPRFDPRRSNAAALCR